MDKTSKLTWNPIEKENEHLLFSGNNEHDVFTGCIGHLRGDFGRSGDEFWTSWFDHLAQLNLRPFKDEFDDVINALRKKGHLLCDYDTMMRKCRDGLPTERDSFGFRAESDRYEYAMRCIPHHGDYNFYVYCYDKAFR